MEQGNDLAYEAKFRTGVHFDGSIFWGPGFKLETTCKVKLRYFPFDRQECDIIFTNWMYGSAYVNYTVMDEPVMVNNYQENGVWELRNYSGSSQEVDYTGTGTMWFPQAKFTLILKRKPLFHAINIMLPCIIISFIAGMVFSLPPASGEKISLGISVVLSYSVLLLLLSDIMPRSSEEMPLISTFICILVTKSLLKQVSQTIFTDTFCKLYSIRNNVIVRSHNAEHLPNYQHPSAQVPF